MSLKQVLAELGVSKKFPFNTLTANWVSVLDKAQTLGLSAQPIRVGTKRVVVAIDRDVRRKIFLIPTFAIFATVFIVLASFSFRPQETKSERVQSQTCLPISAGDTMQIKQQVYLLRDWTLQLEALEKLGGLQKFNLIATCGLNQWTGQVVAANANAGLVIKKLAPTKR